MFKNSKSLSIIALTAILAACGGGSSSDSSGGISVESGPSSTVKITEQCKESNNKITVTKDGCIFSAGGTQTGVCAKDNSLKMLSGTGHTAKDVTDKGTSFSKGVNLNTKTISCTA